METKKLVAAVLLLVGTLVTYNSGSLYLAQKEVLQNCIDSSERMPYSASLINICEKQFSAPVRRHLTFTAGGVGLLILGLLIAFAGRAHHPASNAYEAPSAGSQEGSASFSGGPSPERHPGRQAAPIPVSISSEDMARAAQFVKQLLAASLSMAHRLISLVAEQLKKAGHWWEQQDIQGWAQRHSRILIAATASVAVLLMLYYGFIKPKPDADGGSSASAFVECQKTFEKGVEATYMVYLGQFGRMRYERRSSAQGHLESLLAADRQAYERCVQSAEAHYDQLSDRHAGDPGRMQRFLAAFTRAGGVRRSAGDIERASPRYAEVNSNIASVRAPLPDSSRIIRDLVGKRMTGWTFAYASEFKGVKSISERIEGDHLILRIFLDLEDYITKELFYAVLDLKYSSGFDGEWRYDGLTQLVYAEKEINYLVDGQIFLVGEWRWQQHYATYNPDGTWFGTWDSGGEAKGTWKIVRKNLILTLGGNNWINSEITSFSNAELMLDNSQRAERDGSRP